MLQSVRHTFKYELLYNYSNLRREGLFVDDATGKILEKTTWNKTDTKDMKRPALLKGRVQVVAAPSFLPVQVVTSP